MKKGVVKKGSKSKKRKRPSKKGSPCRTSKTASSKEPREGSATPGSLRKLPNSIHQKAIDLLPMMSKAQKDFTLSVLACAQVSDKQKNVLQDILQKVVFLKKP